MFAASVSRDACVDGTARELARDEIAVVQARLGDVPAILRVPPRVTKSPILLWHGFGPPASESELMKALPLDDVAAIKVYLGLPLFGARAPASGADSVASRQAEDYGSRIFEPVVIGAANELRSVVSALSARGCMRAGEPIGLFGFSAGGAAALFALAERGVPVSAAVTVNAPTGLNASIEALERATKRTYAWTPATRALAERSDSIRRAAEIAAGKAPPAVLLFHGAEDTVVTPQGATSLRDALLPFYRASSNEARLKLVIAPGVSHDWTKPGTLQELSVSFTDWFNRYLFAL